MKFPVRALCFVLLFAATAAAQTTYNTPFQHVIVIVQENRTVDNVFGSKAVPPFETGVNVQNYGYLKVNGVENMIKFGSQTLTGCYDLGHNHGDWSIQWDKGALDQQVQLANYPPTCTPPQYHAYQYLTDDPNGLSLVSPYFSIAENYGFANYMFQTNQGPSFPAHQFLFSGTSAPITDPTKYYDWFLAENPPKGSGAAGCVADQSVAVEGIPVLGGETTNWYTPTDPPQAIPGFPCYNHPTMVDVLNSVLPPLLPITWKYYAQDQYGIWTAPAAIDPLCVPSGFGPTGVCQGSAFTGTSKTTPNVSLPAAQIFSDIQNCNLAQVSWVTPDGNWSDHPGTNSDGTANLGYGASWVADIINAIGNGLPGSTCPPSIGPYWSNTVILVTWDDWGGWQDHVRPPDCITSTCSGYSNLTGQQYVYGFRVPLLVVSAYTPKGYVSGSWNGVGNPPTTCPTTPNTQYCHDFGSILNFIEYVFGTGGQRLEYIGGNLSPYYAYADNQALDSQPACVTCNTYSLSDFFTFSNQPRTFVPISAPVPTTFFTTYTGNVEDPDDDAIE
jgi:phospholipase C